MRRQTSASASLSAPAAMRAAKLASVDSSVISTYFMCNVLPPCYTSRHQREPLPKKRPATWRKEPMSTQAAAATMHLNTREDSAFRFLGLPTLIRSTAESTGGAFGLIEHWSLPPGFASPYHTHSREDEAFYVLEGEMAFIYDGAW